MSPADANQRTSHSWGLRLLALVALSVIAFLAVTGLRVVHTASLQEVQQADAIVVAATISSGKECRNAV